MRAGHLQFNNGCLKDPFFPTGQTEHNTFGFVALRSKWHSYEDSKGWSSLAWM